MKTAYLAFAAMMVLGFAASAETPYARECRLSGGYSWSISIETQFDTTLCVFGKAAIGSAELAQKKWGNGQALSIEAFLNQTTQQDSSGLCELVDAVYVVAKDTNDINSELCKFSDGSVIELNTLAGGVSDPENAALVRALK